MEQYPSPTFLLGKLLNALLLDPVEYDLQVLERFNRLVEVLEQTLPPESLDQVQQVLLRLAGLLIEDSIRWCSRPSQNIGELAGAYLKERFRYLDVEG